MVQIQKSCFVFISSFISIFYFWGMIIPCIAWYVWKSVLLFWMPSLCGSRDKWGSRESRAPLFPVHITGFHPRLALVTGEMVIIKWLAYPGFAIILGLNARVFIRNSEVKVKKFVSPVAESVLKIVRQSFKCFWSDACQISAQSATHSSKTGNNHSG